MTASGNMRIDFDLGDVLDAETDVLISTANAHLNMSGGVGGAILQRGGMDVQSELWNYLRSTGRPVIDPGSVVRSGPGPLKFKYILHAVTVNVFYESSIDVIKNCIIKSLMNSATARMSSVAMPSLGTGYGPLSLEEFAEALRHAVSRDWSALSRLVVVLRRSEDVDVVRNILKTAVI